MAKAKHSPTKKKGKGAAKATAKSKANGAGKPLLRQPVEGKEYELDLAVPISATEARACGHLMAVKIVERTNYLERRRSIMANLRKEGDAIDEALKELAESFEKHTKKVAVRVRERLIVETNEVEIVRLDTGEVVKRRTASPGDRQQELFAEGPKEAISALDKVAAKAKAEADAEEAALEKDDEDDGDDVIDPSFDPEEVSE